MIWPGISIATLALCIAVNIPLAFGEEGPAPTIGDAANAANAANAEHNLPNILLVIADDMRWDQLSIVQREQGDTARFPFLQTPNLDALSEQGMRFRNAFVTSSLCSPSRASILTGQYNHANGVTNNSTHFPQDAVTWATKLGNSGYMTAYFGKWHHGRQRARPGFDYYVSYQGQGQYFDNTFFASDRWLNYRRKGYVDSRTTDSAIEFLEKNTAKRFAMMVGFKGVHQPFAPMPEDEKLYRGEKIRSVPNENSVPPWSTNRLPIIAHRPLILRKMDAARAITGVDRNLGRLMDALDRLGLADNTLVIFTSDNGFYWGEHVSSDKRSAYEESIRVPLLARLPAVVPAGAVSDELVLNIDLAPTILDVAGLETPDIMHGTSLLPLFTDNPGRWRNAFLYQHWYTYDANQGKNPNWYNVLGTPTILGIRTATQKLVTYPGFPAYTEFFDLQQDPYEQKNLARFRNSVDQVNEMCSRLGDLAQEAGYTPVLPLQSWLAGLPNPAAPWLIQASPSSRSASPPLKYPRC